MNLKLKLALLPLSLTGLMISCSSRPDYGPDNGSRVANFSLTNFKAPADGPEWEKVQVTLTPTEAGKGKAVDKGFEKADFASGDAADVNLKVDYGTYTLNMYYTDKSGKGVYEACAEEKKIKHEINQPKFSVKVKICRTDAGSKPTGDDNTSGDPTGGTTDIIPSADVTVTPELQE